MNKPLYLGLSILELSILLMYEFWYDYVKPAFGKTTVVLYRYRQFHFIHKTDDFCKDIADDVETRFGTSNYKLECNSIERLSPKGKNKK